jgi:hypothetical protein
MKHTLIAIGLLASLSCQVSPSFAKGGVIHSIHASSSSGREVTTVQRPINQPTQPRNAYSRD